MVRNTDDDLVWDKVKDVPKLSKPIAIVCCLIDIIFPGFGTTIAACMTDEEQVSKVQLVVSLFQLLLAPFIIGYIWSWYWAYLFIAKAFEIGDYATGRTPGGIGASTKKAREYNQFADQEGMAESDFVNNQRQGGGGVPVYDAYV